MRRVLAWLRPFIEEFRLEATRRGIVSFDGLLVQAGKLLRSNQEVREHFKERFLHILVDEFQDTDPRRERGRSTVSDRRR